MAMRSVLIIDDEASIRSALEGALGDEGYQIRSAESGEVGLELLKKFTPDIVLLDIWMKGLDGVQVLKQIKQNNPEQLVVMMSGHGTIETAVRTTKLGAYDFIEKPLNLDRLLLMIQNACRARDLLTENEALKLQIKKGSKTRQIIGKSSATEAVRTLIKRVAPTTGSVLITGENGTGKEMVAQSIHVLSSRFSKPFIEVNCAAIPEELIESELFGHERGAFTGAVAAKKGRFDLAHNGTLFLDEIGDMSLKTQAKVLRILQEQKFERVGGTETHQVDVRIIAATNKDLKTEIKAGRFREDLFYRLNVVPFHLVPVRERTDDIEPLTEHFFNEYSILHGRPLRKMTPESVKVLKKYSWPGNVREIKNLVERLVILTPESEEGKDIGASDLLDYLQLDSDAAIGSEFHSQKDLANLSGMSLRDARAEFEKEYILSVLKEQSWNVSKAASVLGIERSHLHKKMKGYGIESE